MLDQLGTSREFSFSYTMKSKKLNKESTEPPAFECDNTPVSSKWIFYSVSHLYILYKPIVCMTEDSGAATEAGLYFSNIHRHQWNIRQQFLLALWCIVHIKAIIIMFSNVLLWFLMYCFDLYFQMLAVLRNKLTVVKTQVSSLVIFSWAVPTLLEQIITSQYSLTQCPMMIITDQN